MDYSNVVDVLKEAIRLLSDNVMAKERYASEIEGLNRRIRITESNSYRIGVIGVTSSGKSTLINSFLGESILPSRASPSSSQLVRCHHSETKRAVIYFEDNSVKEFMGDAVTQELISSYADENLNSQNIKGVREVEISTPSFPFADDVLLIDSPGLDAFGYDGHEKLTMAGLLPTVDMCMLITTCKPTSDHKILEVLDAVSETGFSGMPLILVQNMIDSIQPTPDGKKSKDVVASDHMRRLERIVNQSSIKDQSAVYIVQYSAINAIQGICGKNQILLESSNYQRLVDTLHTVISSIRPIINSSRLINVRNELARIAREAQKDAGSGSDLIETTSFQLAFVEKELNNKLTEWEKNNEESRASIDSIIKSVSNTEYFTPDNLVFYKDRIRTIESGILETISSTNTYLKQLCNQLNIDFRDLSSPALTPQKSFPYLHQILTHKQVPKSGFVARIKRFFGSSSGYETQTVTVTDHKATKEGLLEYTKNIKSLFSQAIVDWQTKTRTNRVTILDEVSLRKKQFDERRLHALESQSYLDISQHLTELVNAISIKENASSQDYSKKRILKPADELSEIAVDKSDYALFTLALCVKKRIQKAILDSLVKDNKCILVLGNDIVSEQFFVSQMLMIAITSETIHSGKNILTRRITLYHDFELFEEISLNDFASVFILINGTQVGASEKQLFSLSSKVQAFKGIKVFWVVQDLQEAINAQAVSDILQELIGFKNEFFSDKQIKILVSHPNPIYNLAITALQEKKGLLHTDKVEITDDLLRLYYLYDDKSRDIIRDIVKAFN